MLLLLISVGCIPVLTSPPGTEDDGPWVAPDNDWPTSEPPEDLEEEGFGEGEVVPDFRFHDQFADEVSLWQFYGNLVLLDISTMWCGPCQELAQDAQAIADDYRDEGFVYVTVLPEDLLGEVPDQEELQSWSTSFSLFEPILADDAGYSYQVVPDAAFPGVLLLDRDMTVIERVESPVTDEAIRVAIEAAL